MSLAADLRARIAALPMPVLGAKEFAATEYAHYDSTLEVEEEARAALAELVGVIEEWVGRRCETCGNTEDERGHYCLLLGIGTRDDFCCKLWEPSP